MPLIEHFLKMTLHITLETGVRYAFFASLAWLLAYVLFRQRWWHRKIVARAPLAADVRREMRDSAITLVIFGAVGAATVLAIKAGWTQMSFQPRHWAWSVGSVAAAILLHDAYFYWTHRMMHHPRLFRRFHRTHHLSTNPTPWAAYAFSPLEDLVQAAIFPIVVLLIPIQPLGFAAFMIWQIIFNVAGHTGYEHHPR